MRISAAWKICPDSPDTIRISAARKNCVDKMGSGSNHPSNHLSNNPKLKPLIAGSADYLALLHTGTLARLIITYPACQLLGKSSSEREARVRPIRKTTNGHHQLALAQTHHGVRKKKNSRRKTSKEKSSKNETLSRIV